LSTYCSLGFGLLFSVPVDIYVSGSSIRGIFELITWSGTPLTTTVVFDLVL